MRVVGLVSGGKDSCYNLMMCMEDGHDVVCLANLHPPDGDKEEMDSYMYQCVAHTGLQVYSEACGFPLYRREIRGRPIKTGAFYEVTDDDEVEDLYELLVFVKQKHPDIEAVSSGAILSSYQKNRIQNVCRRLNLESLTYLWNADQAVLFNEIISSGIEAIVVKVAALGLSVKHLGQPLIEMKDLLLDLSNRYGVHICGEGGEYETFVVNCPFFKKRIIVDEAKIVEHSVNNCAEVAYLSLSKLHLENK
ncbi:ATP-binding domain-containing protein 4 [Loa loa]|uniref:Diphthine--ammonia ligase n=1 Tax=Loa loa TaxID=7209 RepID=A0A1I7VYB9_LOALO|nr:ATP-binding domain-containing protein 4 [Loa loa]EFO26677.1 ATP-binding domain-containing protein 4 [Loa loa]